MEQARAKLALPRVVPDAGEPGFVPEVKQPEPAAEAAAPAAEATAEPVAEAASPVAEDAGETKPE
jgi:hypothetical protein